MALEPDAPCLKVLFLSQDAAKVEQLVLALRMRWPDTRPLMPARAVVVSRLIEAEDPDLKALELGADDFIGMPCHLIEVVARVMALMRRAGLIKQQSCGSVIRCGDLVVDPATSEAFLGSNRLALTPTEFRLLHLLVKNRHVTLTREFIRRVLWAGDVAAGEALKKYMQRLRHKLGDDARNPTWISTVHGVGYRFHSPTSNAA